MKGQHLLFLFQNSKEPNNLSKGPGQKNFQSPLKRKIDSPRSDSSQNSSPIIGGAAKRKPLKQMSIREAFNKVAKAKSVGVAFVESDLDS